MTKKQLLERSLAYRNEQAIRKLVEIEEAIRYRDEPKPELPKYEKKKKSVKEHFKLFYKLSVGTIKELRP